MPQGDTRTGEDVVEIVNRDGAGPILLLCEHASSHIPAQYDGLGLRAEDRLSHAAWDPGAHAVALHLSHALNAPMVASRVSRLVYDCNRPPEAPSAMPETSERIEVPGNRGLSPADRQARTQAIYVPFCDAVHAVIAARKQRGQPTILVTMHSFTPIFHGRRRAVEIGILHDEDSRLADAMLATQGALPHRVIRRNEPYGPADGVTHSLKLHGVANGLPNVMIEIRNDLLATPADEKAMAEEILRLLTPALAELSTAGGDNA